MHLRFVDRRLPFQAMPDPLTDEVYSSNWSLPDGMPLITRRQVAPTGTVAYIFSHGQRNDLQVDVAQLRIRRATVRVVPRMSSERDAVDATTEDIVAYRESRLTNAERPVSSATWRRDVVVIRGIYRLLIQTGEIQREPWMTVGASIGPLPPLAQRARYPSADADSVERVP